MIYLCSEKTLHSKIYIHIMYKCYYSHNTANTKVTTFYHTRLIFNLKDSNPTKLFN